MPQPKNWPTAAAINFRLDLSARVNELAGTKLSGKGDLFVKYGKKYGVNPGVVVAIAQRECQLAADGSALIDLNNFGGITDPHGTRGTCGRAFLNGRYWAKYCTVNDGIEGLFKVLAGKPYRTTNGTLNEVMKLYAPADENDWEEGWRIFAAVAKQLGITLDRATPIYIRPTLSQQVKRVVTRT